MQFMQIVDILDFKSLFHVVFKTATVCWRLIIDIDHETEKYSPKPYRKFDKILMDQEHKNRSSSGAPI